MKTRHFFFATVMLLFMANSSAQYGGETGPLTWSLNVNTRTLTIYGEGEMPDYDKFENTYAPWYFAKDFINIVIIENGVTCIGNKAFYSCEELTSIFIPSSVTRIGRIAFSFCFNLSSISISDRVTSIGNMAFLGCYNLCSIYIPDGVTKIGSQVFSFCNSLISIDVDPENSNYSSENGVLFDKTRTTLICCPGGKKGNYIIPYGVTAIGDEAFFYCKDLTSITTPLSVIKIGDRAFSNCDTLITINIPNQVSYIGEEAFAFCSNLASINIPNRITKINKRAFFLCSSLSSIVIPQNVSHIDDEAFFGCGNVTSLTIPCSIKNYGFRSLAGLYKLSIFTNLNPAPSPVSSCVFSESDYCTFYYDNCKLRVPSSAVTVYKNTWVWNSFDIEEGGILVNPIVNNINSGFTLGAGLYKVDTTVTVMAFAFPDCRFINWTKNGKVISTENSYTFTVTEDVELVANFEGNVGISDPRLVPQLHIYPNPTKGELTINNEQLTINNVEIFDIYGRKLSAHHLITSSSHHLINISHFSAGLYFFKISTDAGMVVKKVVKQLTIKN